MTTIPAFIQRMIKPDPEITRLREQCERLRDDVRMRTADVHEGESRLGAIDAQMRQVVELQRSAETRIRVFDWTGKAAAASVVVGLAVGSSVGLLPAAGLFLGGLAGFCGSYVAQLKSRVRWNALEGARGVTDRERAGAQQQIAQGKNAALAAESGLRTTQERLHTLELTRMADHANQGPPAGAVEVSDDAVHLGGIRVPRNVS